MIDYIESYDNLISIDDCYSLINYFNSSTEIQKRGKVLFQGDKLINTLSKESTEISFDKKLREDIKWDSLLRPIYFGLKSAVDMYREKYSEDTDINYAGIDAISRWEMESTFNMQKFEPDQGFKIWHCESSHPSSSQRILTWMVYLNDVPDGGTHFLQQNKIMKAKVGRYVLWPPYWTHFHKSQVSKTTTKYILTGWYSFVS